jgi:hypothetical protein
VPSDPIVAADAVIGSVAMGSDGTGAKKIKLSIAKSGVSQFYQAVAAGTVSEVV